MHLAEFRKFSFNQNVKLTGFFSNTFEKKSYSYFFSIIKLEFYGFIQIFSNLKGVICNFNLDIMLLWFIIKYHYIL